MKLTGKTIWITGASSGIGEALALEAATKNCKLILSARRIDELEKVKVACEQKGATAEVIALDLADSSSIESAFMNVKEKNFKIDILVNNGGVSQRGLTLETQMDVDRKVFEINYFGSVYLTKLVGKEMLLKGGGHIVFTSSVVGLFGFPQRSAYSASKHAIHGFADALRIEYEPKGIKVTVVCPGRIKTNLSYSALEADGTLHNKMDPGQNTGIPVEKCAKLYLQAIEKGRRQLVIARGEKVLVFLRKYWPSLFFFIAKKIKPN